MEENIKRGLNVILGIFVSGIGAAILFEIGWGSAPISTMTEGVSLFLKSSYGLANILINGIFLVLIFIYGRHLIGIGTIISTLLFGFMIDIGMVIIEPLAILNMNLFSKTIILLLGILLNAVGLGYYVGQSFGVGAIDAVPTLINEKTNFQYKYCKLILDTVLAIVGILLGGSWGVGTITAVILTGPIMEKLIKEVKKRFIYRSR